MGISDDITPRRRLRPKPPIPVKRHFNDLSKVHETEKKVVPDVEPEIINESEEIGLKPDKAADEVVEVKKDSEAGRGSRDYLRDSFFEPVKAKGKEGKRDSDEEEPPRGRLPLIIFLLLIGILAAILIYQNLGEIKSLWQDAAGREESESEQTDQVKTTEIVPQDYTTEIKDTTAAPAQTAPAATTPASAPAATVDKAALTIQVLNGNGITGSADKAKSLLTTAGFKVGSVTNARNFSYDTTKIYYKPGKAEAAKLIKETLTGYESTTEESAEVAKTYDVVVVVGKK